MCHRRCSFFHWVRFSLHTLSLSPSLSVSHGEHKSYTDIPCIYFNDNTTNIDTDCWKHSLTPSDCYKATTITDMQSIHQMAINNAIYLAHTYTQIHTHIHNHNYQMYIDASRTSIKHSTESTTMLRISIRLSTLLTLINRI